MIICVFYFFRNILSLLLDNCNVIVIFHTTYLQCITNDKKCNNFCIDNDTKCNSSFFIDFCTQFCMCYYLFYCKLCCSGFLSYTSANIMLKNNMPVNKRITALVRDLILHYIRIFFKFGFDH